MLTNGSRHRVQTTLLAAAAIVAVAATATTAGATAPHSRIAAAAHAPQTVRRTASSLRTRTAERRRTSPVPVASAPTSVSGMPLAGLFGPTSVWEQKVDTAPVAANSAAMVRDLVGHITDRYGDIAAFNAHDYAMAFYTASAGTGTVDVAFDDCQHKGYTPAGLEGPGGQFTDVPIPAGAVPASGTDHSLAIYSPSTDQLWELWETEHTAQGWSACWGGRIDHVSTAAGYFTGGFGATASGLAVSAGTVELSEVRAGSIPHALALAIPDTAAWPKLSYPAQRTDGGDTDASAIPEGTRLRLDPNIDVDTIPGLSPIARVIAHTAQTYGFIVTDSSGAVSVTAESGTPQQTATGVDPWAALEGGLPDYLVLQGFPWGSLQALPQNWGEPAS